MGLSKKRKIADSKVDSSKTYSLEEASKLMKEIGEKDKILKGFQFK